MTPAPHAARNLTLQERISQEMRQDARDISHARGARDARDARNAPREETNAPGWLRRAIRDEDILLFLLGVRWISLLPAALALLAREETPPFALAPAAAPIVFYVFGVAMLCNVALSLWHPLADRALTRRPWLLGVDLAIVAAFLALTGGPDSPYGLYANAPLLAAAFFFGMRGAWAALALAAFYLLALATLPRASFTLDELLSQILAFFLIALMFGYPAVLLQRLKAANDELQRAQEDVQRATALAALGKTVAHVSHEIRNPLVTLGGFARRIMRSPDDSESVRQHAQIIVEEAARLESLLTNVLVVARPPQLKMSRGNLHEVLDQACLLAGGASAAANAGQVAIEKDYDPSLPWLRMNAPALLRAFLNVLRNAVQAMPEGGTLKIATRYDSEHEMAEVTVTDDGPGIPADIVSTLFEPFVSRREQGTGLGLAITRQIVQEHCGSLKAGNAPNGGAQFTFRLPLAPREE